MADDNACSSCRAALLPAAPFCHNCGLPAHPGSSPSAPPSDSPLRPTPERLQVVLDDPAPLLASASPVAPQPDGFVDASTPPAATSVTPASRGGLGSATKGFLAAGAVAVAVAAGFLAYGAITEDSDPSAASSASPAPESGDGSASPDTGEGGSVAPSGEGSEDAFCNEVEEIIAELRVQADELAGIPEDDPLAGLAFLFSAINDLQVYTNRMLEAAPAEIRSDMEIVAETIAAVTSNDVEEIALALFQAYAHQDSFERVDAYTAEHCDISLFGPQATA